MSKTRNCVSKTRNFVLKMMKLQDGQKIAAATKVLCEQTEQHFEMNFGEDCVCAPVLYGGWVRTDLQKAAQRLAFGKILSERLAGSSQL